MSHRRHHFVPQFYLRNWVGPDDKLACYRRIRGHMIVSRLGPRSVAYKEGLYALPEAPEDQRQRIEKDFFKTVDERAARVHRLLVDVGPAGLSVQDRADWSVFLLSLRIRTPQSIDRIRTDATSHLLQGLNRDPEQYDRLRKPQDPPTLLEWVQKNAPAVIANYGTKIVPQLIVSDGPLRHVFGMHWWTQRLSDGSEFMTSDHPCVYTTGLGKPSCMIALPLTPKVVFYAANRRDLEASFSARSSQVIAMRTNESVVSQAFEYVFASQGNKKLFVAKHLRPPSPARGKP